MTTDPNEVPTELDKLGTNLKKIEDLSQRLVAALASKPQPRTHAPGPDFFARASTAMMSDMLTNPSKLIEQQAGYWGQMLGHYAEAQRLAAAGKIEAPEDGGPSDPRFVNPLWQTNPYFNFLKQQYQMTAQAITDTMTGVEGLAPRDKDRLNFLARQITDMMAPTNFLATNPEALEKAVATDGQSLVEGLENFVRDVEESQSGLSVSLADKTAFKVGQNIATTEGAVVFRNRMFELIQYAPRTETVKKTPLLIFPPWINKFYILDLREKNSLIRWIVDQGYTLFVVSWVNPDETYADVGMDQYIGEGYQAAIDTVKAITGEDQINAVGYCIGGTALSLTLALHNKRGDKSVKSATMFTTLTDFSDPGELGFYTGDDYIEGIVEEVGDLGYFPSHVMNRTFSYLRANDLVYGPAIRRYMMGEAPPAFDLLYWNGDGTNLPGCMTRQYLRELYQQNLFAGDGIEICGETLRIGDMKHPVCSIACQTDHIALWTSCFDGLSQFGSRSKTFILSESGHIAGIVNPPGRPKYGHYVGGEPKGTAQGWLDGATRHDGSWWPEWEEWLSRRSGKAVPARAPGSVDFPVLGAAPGSYVLGAKP